MSPLERLAVCVGKMLAQVEMWFPGLDDDALEPEAALVDAEAESEVHEPALRTVQSLGIDERDTVWRSNFGTLWRWDENRWWHHDADGWSPAPYDYWPSGTAPYVAVDPRVAATDWHGWAVPAILEVLAEHHWAIVLYRRCECGVTPIENIDQWREHVAPLIAARIGCDPQRAIEALSHYKPDRVSP